MTDLNIQTAGQRLPLYWYEDHSETRRDRKQESLFDDNGNNSLIRHNCVSDYALNSAIKKYNQNITKEDIFYYVYGYLHSPEYKEIFSDDLKYSLPRIDFVDDYDEFQIFSIVGRDLAELHLNYENIEAPDSVRISGVVNIEDILHDDKFCHVKKMRAFPDKGKVVYNKNITIKNIPAEAFEYVVNGFSAIEWIIGRYQYIVDKKSGIVDDSNEYAGGSYVLRLLLSVINVSILTMKIVKGLPKLNFEEEK